MTLSSSKRFFRASRQLAAKSDSFPIPLVPYIWVNTAGARIDPICTVSNSPEPGLILLSHIFSTTREVLDIYNGPVTSRRLEAILMEHNIKTVYYCLSKAMDTSNWYEKLCLRAYDKSG